MSKTIKSALPLLLGNICVLFLLTAGGLFSFTTAYDLEPDNAALLLGCAGAALLFAVLWSVPRGGWAALGLLGLDALAAWRLWETLEPAADIIVMAVFGSSRREFRQLQTGAEGILTLALLLLAAALASILGWLAVRERCWHLPAVLVTVPLLSAIMSGVLPDLLPLLAETAGWGTLLLTSLYNRRDTSSLGRGLWLSLGGISALLAALLAALPQEGYTRPQWATDTRDNLLQAVTQGLSAFWDGGGSGVNLWNLDFGVSSARDEIDGQVDLTAAGSRRFTGNIILQVIGGKPGRTYLRGGSSAIYTGDGWEKVDPEEYQRLKSDIFNMLYDGVFSSSIILNPRMGFSSVAEEGLAEAVTLPLEPAVFPALTALPETPVESMTLRHRRASGNTAYFPYRFCNFPDGLAELDGDGGAVRTMGEYQIEYIPGGPEEGAFASLTGNTGRAEELYREFVYQHYLNVPEEAAQALEPLLWSELSDPPAWPGGLLGEYREAAFLAVMTARQLENAAVYDLNVSRMEPGEDFVRHFLEEGRGYCVHFATAGTLLLRMHGIPARYVEGYAPWIGQEEVSDVRDSDAHAWVEIYLDGYGWYPVEMTPGRQGETPDTLAPEILQTGPLTIPEEETTEESRPEENRTEEERPAEPSGGEEESGEEAEQESLDLSWIWKAAAVLLALSAPFDACFLVRLARKKRREHPDTNRSVIYAYLAYRRLLKRGGPEEPELEELGRKAKFSQHLLAEEERERAWQCVRHAEERRKQQKKQKTSPI